MQETHRARYVGRSGELPWSLGRHFLSVAHRLQRSQKSEAAVFAEKDRFILGKPVKQGNQRKSSN